MPPHEPAGDGRVRVGGHLSVSIVGAYVVLLLLMYFLVAPKLTGPYVWVPYGLLAFTLLFLARYLSTGYTIDDTSLRAWRFLGGRTILLEEVRQIEYASLRDIVPISAGIGMGSWGWRGRMYSPTIGDFDSIYTDPAAGLLVTAGTYPLFISPKDPVSFARELSRRVRSYTGPLAHDVGDPRHAPPPQ